MKCTGLRIPVKMIGLRFIVAGIVRIIFGWSNEAFVLGGKFLLVSLVKGRREIYWFLWEE